ncbi:MAG: methyltransferase domain-containing protein [Clostridiales bacterium]|nr:methyltransferase domain-containing protein [Clostridiales bacterium]
MSFDFRSARHWAQAMIQEASFSGMRAIDATMGNGYDTAWLCELVGEQGLVYAFDIQAEALERTAARLETLRFEERARLFHSGHENAADFVTEQVDVVLFNLGWLPGTEKILTTRTETTLKAVQVCLDLLKEGGLMTICVYPGHEEGTRELHALTQWACALPAQEYDVVTKAFLNQPNDPPVLIAVKKNKRRK